MQIALLFSLGCTTGSVPAGPAAQVETGTALTPPNPCVPGADQHELNVTCHDEILEHGQFATLPDGLFGARAYRSHDPESHAGMACNGDEQLVGGGCTCDEPGARMVKNAPEGPPARLADGGTSPVHAEYWDCACDRGGVSVDALCLRGVGYGTIRRGITWREQ